MTRLLGMLLLAIWCGACGHAPETSEPAHELAKTRVRDLDVVLLSADEAMKTGKDTVTVEFRAVPDGHLVDVGTVKASATMPMTGMAPMFGPIEIAPTAVGGRYLATSDLSMAGEWRLSLEWSGPAGPGSATLTPMVH